MKKVAGGTHRQDKTFVRTFYIRNPKIHISTYDSSIHQTYQDSLASHYIVRLKECILGKLHTGILQDMRMAEELNKNKYDNIL